MLRLVFCDVDGTLLPAGETTLSGETLDTLRRLTDRGVTVAIASGRSYGQMRPLFGALAHRLVFLCLDGALLLHRDCVLYKQPLCRRAALSLLEQYPHAAVHGRNTRYRLGTAPGEGWMVHSPGEIAGDILKLELWDSRVPPPDTRYRIAYRQPGLTELVAPTAHKGHAATVLLKKWGVAPQEAAAFGDGENDASLLAAVGHPYRMRGSRLPADIPETSSVTETLRTLFSL